METPDHARTSTRRERIRAMREKILASYAEAAADPDFMREVEEIDGIFDVTVGDGLEVEEWDSRSRI